jgi:hypothetical protein
MRVVFPSLLVLVLVAGCWPPTKFGGAAGGSLGGAVVTDPHGLDHETDSVPAGQARMLVVPTALRSNALDRRWDVALGWEGEWLVPEHGGALLRHGFVAEGTWYAAAGEPTADVRWRVGPSVEASAYRGGYGALVGVAAAYAFDKWQFASRPDATHRMLGDIVGDMSAAVFLRGGIRNHDGDRDAVILGGVELTLPGFCMVCGVSGGDD